MTGKISLDRKILDTALELAERSDWESVRLHDIAQELHISLDEIRQHFREKEDLVDAWFDRADQAMLAASAAEEFKDKSSREKIHTLLMQWLDALSIHRRVTRQMIFGKLEPGHLHYQFNGLMRVSRTVQWLREAAGRKARLPIRALEETGLTTLYLATFLYWMFDDSQDSQMTNRFLNKRLDKAERFSRWCGCSKSQQGEKPGEEHRPVEGV